jgi:hypothetical protein
VQLYGRVHFWPQCLDQFIGLMSLVGHIVDEESLDVATQSCSGVQSLLSATPVPGDGEFELQIETSSFFAIEFPFF